MILHAVYPDGKSMTRLSRGEYWLLNHVVDCWFELAGLADHKFITIDLNKTHHGLSDGELLDTLDGMFRNGWIKAARIEDAMDASYSPCREEIRNALNESDWRMNRETLHFGITPAGGSVWEEFARPNWDRYLQISSFGDDEYRLTSIHKSIIENYVRYAKECIFEVIAGSDIWTQLTPHLIMDWKKVPSVWELSIRVRPTESYYFASKFENEFAALMETTFTKEQLASWIVKKDLVYYRRDMESRRFDYLHFYDWR